MAGNRSDFYCVLTAAITDLTDHGFDSQERLDRWLEALRAAARAALVSENVLQRSLADALSRVFARSTRAARLMKFNPGVSRFTLELVKPKLRAELDRRILASANLITLNRDASIARTLQRFAGWATSIPAGGSKEVDRPEVKKAIRRGVAGLPFEERRVIIDQGHKLVAAINDIVATDGGAIAAIWRHVPERRPAYDARPEHVARNGKVFLVRDSWAHKAGYVKPESVGYTDDVTQPAEEPYCRCSYEYLYALRDLPERMLTAKGKAALLEARKRLEAVA